MDQFQVRLPEPGQLQYLPASLHHLPIPNRSLQFIVDPPQLYSHQEANSFSREHLQDFLHLDWTPPPLNHHLITFNLLQTHSYRLFLDDYK